MKDGLCTRQICFIVFAYSAVLKLLLYPSYIAAACGNALIFPALFALVLQTAAVWAVAFLSSKTDKTFFELLESTFGNAAAKVIYALFALYFLFTAITPLSEQQLLVHEAFYDTVPSLFVFLPVYFFLVYAGTKGFTNAGRAADLCLPLFVVAAAVLVAMSVSSCDLTRLLPIFRQPAKEVAGAAWSSLFRFSESAYLIMFLGRFKYKSGDCAKITLSYLGGGIVVIIFLAVFFGVFGELAQSRAFAISGMASFSPSADFVGRADLIAVYVLEFVALFATALCVQACTHCLSYVFGKDIRWAYSPCACAILAALTFVLNYKFSLLQEIAARWFAFPALVFAYALPPAAWLLRRNK